MASAKSVSRLERDNELSKTFRFSDLSAVELSNGDRQRALIACDRNSKEPLGVRIQPHHMSAPEVETIIASSGYNVGIALNTQMLDVDFDTFDTKTASIWEYFLPHTNYKIGRDSKPTSHWIYCLTADFSNVLYEYKHIIDFLAHDFKVLGKQVKVEYRYRNQKHNDFTSHLPAESAYVFAPGSIHPSGELVKWSKEADFERSVSRGDASVIMKRSVLAAICAMLVPHWIEGSRQYMCMALSGALFRMANVCAPEEVLEDTRAIVFELADFEDLIRGICEFAEDKEAGTRIQTLRQTWRKSADPELKVTGGLTLSRFLGDDGSHIIHQMFRLITGATSSINVQELVERFFIEQGTGCILDTKLVGTESNWRMTRTQFKDSYASHSVLWQGKRIGLDRFCYGYGILGYVHGMGYFAPERLTLEHYSDAQPVDLKTKGPVLLLNVWRPYEVKPAEEPVSASEVKPFLDYMRTLYGSSFDYMMAYLANIIQSPALKPRTYPIIVGASGAGKTFLFEHILNKILGENHCVTNDNVEGILTGWNNVIKGKVLVVFEEAIYANRNEVSNKLKQFVTGQKVIIREKHVNERELVHYCRPVFISNNEDNAVALDALIGERRASVIKVSDELVGKTEYFKKLVDWVRDNLPNIHRYLFDYKYDPNVIETALASEAKSAMQRYSAIYTHPEIFWLMQRIEEGFPLDTARPRKWYEAFHSSELEALREGLEIDNATWPDRISLKALRDDVRYWATQNRIASTRLPQLTQKLFSIIPNLIHHGQLKVNDTEHGITTTYQPTLYTFPTRFEIIEALRPQYGHLFSKEIEAIAARGNVPVLDVTVKGRLAL